MTSLKNKVALITGGSKGIGYGIAQALLNAEMKVAITGRNIEHVQKAANELMDITKGECIAIQSDVKDFDSQSQAIETLQSTWGKLDVLIANAGVGHFASIEDLEIEQWNNTIDTNLTGVFYSIKAALPLLKKSKGYIITISSLAGTNFFPKASAYNASKFGLTGFSQAVMLDLRQYGIKVSTIMPGSVSSYFNNHQPNESDAWKIQPEDIGQMVQDLLEMHPRTLPSKIEVRPSIPPKK